MSGIGNGKIHALPGRFRRVFWPSNIARSDKPGVLVGWRNDELDVVVIGVMEGVDPGAVEKALKSGILYRHPKHKIGSLLEICSDAPIHVLGVTNPAPIATTLSPTTPTSAVSASYILIATHGPYPILLQSPGRFNDPPSTSQMILFDPPEPIRMQFLSLTPIALALGQSEGALDDLSTFDDDPENFEAAFAQRKQRALLIEKLKLHTVRSHKPSAKELALPALINQINCTHEIGELLRQNASLIGVRSRRALSVSERVVESATTIRDYVLWNVWDLTTVYLYPFALNAFLFGVIIYRLLAEVLLLLLDWRWQPRSSTSSSTSSSTKSSPFPALKDVSATAQQIDLRLQQFCWWPYQYLLLRSRKQNWESITTSHTEYIRFFNSLWLVANDLLVGAVLGYYLLTATGSFTTALDRFAIGFCVHDLRAAIRWLMGWPAGLKLNEELADFLGDLFLWVLDHWGVLVQRFVAPHWPAIVYFLAFTSFLGGASMPLALLSDLCSLLSLHIYCFYLSASRIYNWQLTIIVSLFHLFRGKKRNVLRNRIDSCDYALDQLLLGTILFTLLFFLLPTIIVFYLTFASARMAIIAGKAGIDILLALLNHFPIFALMLRVKDAKRLPGGISFELLDYNASTASPPREVADQGSNAKNSGPPHTPADPVSYIYLRTTPLSFRSMFNQYFSLASRLRQHYLSGSVVFSLATGRFVPPIRRNRLYSLQYSMLPSQRKGVIDLWVKLMEHGGNKDSAFAGVSQGTESKKRI